MIKEERNPNRRWIPAKFPPEIIDEMMLKWRDGTTIKDIAREYGIAPSTVHGHVCEYRKTLAEPAKTEEGADWAALTQPFVNRPDLDLVVKFLTAIELGMSEQATLELLGDTTLLKKWRKRYIASMDVWIKMAQRRFEQRHLEALTRVAAKDGKVALMLLERNRTTREDYAQEKADTTIKIDLGFTRGPDPFAGHVIEAITTQEALSLPPAKPNARG